MTKTCTRKHTKYQHPDDEPWVCPKCGSDTFALDSDSDEACDLIHNNDWVNCYECDYGASATEFSKLMMRKQNMIECPCCKGKGVVKKTFKELT